MTIASADVLSSHLRPLCWRDNHVMKSEPGRSWSNAENQASYHCGFEGYSVRYDSTDGYYMLIGMPPSRDTTTGCGIEGCDYGYDARTKGDWVSDLGEVIRSHTTKAVLPCMNAENYRE